jgi:integrase
MGLPERESRSIGNEAQRPQEARHRSGKPSAPRRRAIVPVSPADVERLRAALDPASELLVSLLAYAGMRPEEALALEWRHIGKTTILVEQKLVEGDVVVGQKTPRPPRAIDLLSPLREDLRRYHSPPGAQRTDLQA